VNTTGTALMKHQDLSCKSTWTYLLPTLHSTVIRFALD